MKINRLEIANFGKFSDYTLDLSQGFQIIYGSNEDGKSTLMSFIEMMFYSDHGRSRALNKNNRLKYQPWNGSPMEGALVFTYNKTSYRLQKLLGATLGRDKVELIDLSSNTNVPLKQGVEVGAHFFGLDLEGFRRSSFIGQIGHIEVGAGTDMVAEKLLHNIVESGDESFSQQEVSSRLDSAAVNLKTKRGTGGIMVDASRDLQGLLDEKEQVEFLLRQQQELTQEYVELEQLAKQKANMEKTIHLYRNKTNKEQLEKLLKNIENIQGIKGSISTDNFSFSRISSFLDEGDELLSTQNQLLQGIKPLKESLENTTAPEITQKDFSHFQTLLKIRSQGETLTSFYGETLLPAWDENADTTAAYKEVESVYNEKKSAFEALKSSDDRMLKLKEEKKVFESDLIKVEARLESHIEQESAKLDLEQQKLDFAKSRLEELNSGADAKKSPNLVFLLLSIVLAVLSVVSGILVTPYAYGGLALFLLFFILSFVNKVPTKNKEKIREAEEKLDTAKADIIKVQEDIASHGENLEKENEFLKENLKKTSSELERLSLIENDYLSHKKDLEDTEAPLQQSVIHHQNAMKSLVKAQSRFAEMVKDSVESFDGLGGSSSLDIVSLGTSLNTVIAKCEAEISEMLLDKKANDPEDFQQKHLDYQSNERNRQTVEKMTADLNTVKQDFTESINNYKSAATFADAYNIYLDLREMHNKVQSLEKEISHTASGMGIADYSKDSVLKALEEIPTSDSVSIPENIDKLEEQLNAFDNIDIISKMKELSGQIRMPERSLEQIEMDIKEVSEQVDEMEDYYSSLAIAREIMESAQEEMRQSFGPQLDEKTSEIFSRITSGKYDNVVINKDYEIKVKSGVHLREYPFLSSGTIDQAYLSLRLAISQLISDDNVSVPIFLDDILIQYDDKRAERAIEFLREYSEELGIQIVLFSCHSRMLDLAEGLKIPTFDIL